MYLINVIFDSFKRIPLLLDSSYKGKWKHMKECCPRNTRNSGNAPLQENLHCTGLIHLPRPLQHNKQQQYWGINWPWPGPEVPWGRRGLDANGGNPWSEEAGTWNRKAHPLFNGWLYWHFRVCQGAMMRWKIKIKQGSKVRTAQGRRQDRSRTSLAVQCPYAFNPCSGKTPHTTGATTREATATGSPRTATKSGPCSLQLEEAHTQQWRSRAAKSK